MFKRSSGVLLNISSLPSEFGIGDFGEGARYFVDFLNDIKMKWWQILPLCPVGSGNSPYSSVSAFAINPLYVDPIDLMEKGLLTSQEVESFKYQDTPYTTDYNYARQIKAKILKLAFERDTLGKDFEDFEKENSFWVKDYALYMANKEANNDEPWWEWKEKAKSGSEKYYIYEQYIAHTQWHKLKKYANDKGVFFLGDMPIYVSRDSSDFYYNMKMFMADDEGNLKLLAGCPPDYFSEDGQLWGNPIYDWDAMKKDGYKWWLERIGDALNTFDAVRIDHFRGFHQFWAVPAGEKTARNGKWLDGPAMDLFEKVNKKFENPNIVAEDLGVSNPELKQFLQETGYPGMKIMQFGFNCYDSDHVPYKYGENCVAYTGTHDNETMLGWLWSMEMEEKTRLLKYCRYFGDNWGEGGENSRVIKEIITTLWQTVASIAIVPIQDMCGFGGDTRMNVPGRAEGNWQFRITKPAIEKIDKNFYRELNHIYGRG
ncbi:MAG: 4-alpha-glucanotransferase [Clostridiales bacterium]|nr:4-alpha-glucanotransferase [Clostridiales bacterium]